MIRFQNQSLWTLTALAGAMAVWWAFRPLPEPDLALPEVSEAPTPQRVQQLAALDTGVFSSPLWVAPPPPPPPPAAPPPPPPLPAWKLQLIAIVTDGSAPNSLRSVLMYDPDTDRMVTLHVGDEVAGRKVERITSNTLELKEGTSGLKTITLVEAIQPLPGLTGGGR